MITLFRSLVVALMLAFAGFLPAKAALGSEVVVLPEIVDFGTVTKGSPVEVRFVLENRGVNPLTVQFMEFSDPGLLARVSPVISPGGAVEAVVYWKTSKLFGNVTGSVVVSFADNAQPPVSLTLEGFVLDTYKE